MAEEQAAHHLLNVLEERGLDAGLDLDKVLTTFLDDNTKKEAAAWVNEYLNEETLLTREEWELWVGSSPPPVAANISQLPDVEEKRHCSSIRS